MSRCQKFKLTMFITCTFLACAKSNTKSSGSCLADKSCVCITNLNEFVLHCEGDVHVTLPLGHGKGKFSCNNTLPSKRLNRNYHSLLQLNLYKVREITFFECPQPSNAYTSLFISHSELLPPRNVTPELHYPIASLEINCGARSEFTIERKNFQGLNKLQLLEIRCPALLDLANDLFYEPLPRLFSIEIEIKSTYIPEMLFSKLEKLQHIDFIGSQVKMLQKNCLTGPKNLLRINFSGNKIEYIDDDIFYDHTGIENIDLSNNYISVLPVSLESLHKLEILNLEQNILRNFKLKDCSSLSNLYILNLKNNLITDIDLECISQFDYLTSLDVTGNYILTLPGTQISMRSLDFFTWNHNSASNIHLDQFLIANNLISLKLINSSITSVSAQALQGLPFLKELDLSFNSIKYIPEDFFIHNLKLVKVMLQGNMLSELPQGIFKNNTFLSYVNLKSNLINNIDAAVLARNPEIDFLDLSQNQLQEIPENFLLDKISYLNFSFNHIKSLHSKLFTKGSNLLVNLDLSHNMLVRLPRDIFLPLNESKSFRELNLHDNKLVSLPGLVFPNLLRLNLAGNRLSTIPGDAFQKLPALEQLDLSRNLMKEINPPFLSLNHKILSLDLSSNKLQNIREYTFIDVSNLRTLNLSNNRMTRFTLESILGATGLYELDLSNNSMSFFGVYSSTNFKETVRRICFGISEGVKCKEMAESFPIKVLKLSNNKLNFNYTQLKYNEVAGTWGRISPLLYCKKLEEVYLNDNDIDEIFLDWRVDFPFLKLLDLQRNKFKNLTHQEQLFSTVKILENGATFPYNFSRPMVINLQENLISSIELPSSLLVSNSEKNRNSTHRLLLGHNPLKCDCRLLNLLRVVNKDVSLSSEIERRTGKKWMLPAELDTNNLRCWLPASVRGKKIDEPEEWIHHILPMFGLCSLQDDK